jgi:hydroxymethylpyrimidine pyrophosphatase-like HAD family hydrolase
VAILFEMLKRYTKTDFQLPSPHSTEIRQPRNGRALEIFENHGIVSALVSVDTMSLSVPATELLRSFVERSGFARTGGIVTDLDGTAIHEDAGRIYIPKPVEFGLKALHDQGRPFVLNTLRFPLSVLRTFGRDWYRISNAAIPAVTLNGSLLGYVIKTDQDEMAFQEIAAFPLLPSEIEQVLKSAEELLAMGIKNLLFFYYPRDWRMGEIIWTPLPERVLEVKERYVSASSVTAVELPKLRDQLLAEEICMIFLLIEVLPDPKMAYQYTQRNNFFTTKGVDKLSGAEHIAQAIGFKLESSLGAGDTELDIFLRGVGLAVIVGRPQLQLQGLISTVRLKDSFELGELLFQVAEITKEAQ